MAAISTVLYVDPTTGDHSVILAGDTIAPALFPAAVSALASLALVQGDILYHNGTALTRLAAGTAGQVLTTGGPAGNPSWAAAGGAGVTSLTGTLNQITVSSSTGAITLTLPQDIAATSSPTFVDVTTTGIHKKGTLTYVPTNPLTTLQSSVNSHNQVVVQNSNAGTSASSNFVVNNDVSTDTTNYGEFGINSSAFSATGRLNAASIVYVAAQNYPLVLGTWTAQPIDFVVGNAASPNLRIGAANQWELAGVAGTAGQVLTSQGAAAAPTWTTLTIATPGADKQVLFNDAGTGAGDADLTWDKTANVLTLNGTIKLAGGAPGAGKVLTSDATGAGSWQTPASSSSVSLGLVYAIAAGYPLL